LDYTPTISFTVVYESKLETSNTAFIPQWYPVSNFFVSVEKSVLNVDCPENLGFKKMEFNFENFKIKNNRYCNATILYGKIYQLKTRGL
jgi:hypothetical protein